MKNMEEYTPNELIALISILGILIDRKFNIIQKLVEANIFSFIVQTNLIANPENLDINLCSINNDLQKQIDKLKKRVEKLEDDKNSQFLTN